MENALLIVWYDASADRVTSRSEKRPDALAPVMGLVTGGKAVCPKTPGGTMWTWANTHSHGERRKETKRTRTES